MICFCWIDFVYIKYYWCTY